MFRLRLATVAVAASLGLVSGCLCLPCGPLFGWLHPSSWSPDCCETGALPDSQGAILDDCGPAIVAPGPQGIVPPQDTMPDVGPMPRLAPIPQSRITPYSPQSRSYR